MCGNGKLRLKIIYIIFNLHRKCDKIDNSITCNNIIKHFFK